MHTYRRIHSNLIPRPIPQTPGDNECLRYTPSSRIRKIFLWWTVASSKLRPPFLACQWCCFWQSWALRIDGGAATWTMLDVGSSARELEVDWFPDVPRGLHSFSSRPSQYVQIRGCLNLKVPRRLLASTRSTRPERCRDACATDEREVVHGTAPYCLCCEAPSLSTGHWSSEAQP